jgi:prohibitin 2
MLSRRKAGFGGGFPGGGRGGMGLVGTLVLAGLGTYVASNALFNGMLCCNYHWTTFLTCL